MSITFERTSDMQKEILYGLFELEHNSSIQRFTIRELLSCLTSKQKKDLIKRIELECVFNDRRTRKKDEAEVNQYKKELAFFERMIALLKMEIKLLEDGESTGQFRAFRKDLIEGYLKGDQE